VEVRRHCTQLTAQADDLTRSLAAASAELAAARASLMSAESAAAEKTTQQAAAASELQDMRKLFGQLSEKMSKLE